MLMMVMVLMAIIRVVLSNGICHPTTVIATIKMTQHSLTNVKLPAVIYVSSTCSMTRQ